VAVCHGPSCSQNGSAALFDAASLLAASCARGYRAVRIERSDCLGHCGAGTNVGIVSGTPGAVPAVKVGITYVNDLARILSGDECSVLEINATVLRAIQCKEMGNDAFAVREDMAAAIENYTEALAKLDEIRLYPEPSSEAANEILERVRAGILANRSGAFAGSGNWERALSDADAAIECCPTLVAGFKRKGDALEALGRQREAADVLEAGASLETVNRKRKELQKRANKLRHLRWKPFG
jgi:hypothetical protein